tara:strand:- start:12 stop:260 length:249 start_codon:yes stop_codon:yes gene_type:complete
MNKYSPIAKQLKPDIQLLKKFPVGIIGQRYTKTVIIVKVNILLFFLLLNKLNNNFINLKVKIKNIKERKKKAIKPPDDKDCK